MLILSGGEPLLREDLTEIARYASEKGATVVVGTNGTLLSDERIAALKQAGVRGVAVSVDSLRPTYHDNFRHGRGSLADTQRALARLAQQRLDFIIQTTVTKGNRAELAALVEWSAAQGAVSFNCYFLVSTGRGARSPISRRGTTRRCWPTWRVGSGSTAAACWCAPSARRTSCG